MSILDINAGYSSFIPALWVSDKVGMLLGSKTGKVISVESDGGKIFAGKWLGVCVLVDVTKPLN